MLPLLHLALALPVLLAASASGRPPAPPSGSTDSELPALDGVLWPPSSMVRSAVSGVRSEYGVAVAVDSVGPDGAAWALVGAPRAAGGGRVRVHRRVGGGALRWPDAGRSLIARDRVRPGALLGAAVAIRGSLAAAGAPRAEGAGRVFVRRLGPRGPEGPTVELRPSPVRGGPVAFGAALALWEGPGGRARLAVGAPHSTVEVPGRGAVELAGEVHVFVRSGSSKWTLERILQAPLPRFAARFGTSVCFVGDHVVVGAPGDDRAGPGSGRVHVFGSTGASVLELGPPGIPASAPGARYGERVVALDGARFVAAAPGLAAVEAASITPAGDLVHDGLLSGSVLEGFGAAVAAGRGVLYVGEPRAGVGAHGRVAVFSRRAGGWHRAGSLHPIRPDAAGEFGASVAADGQLVLVGEPGDGGPCPPASADCGAGGATAFSG
ncbi:MAG: FG-GAP repeat protein [Planctomycetota bacterium]|nr:FG-GAP repeat protein [Planctomycetota bacterium]